MSASIRQNAGRTALRGCANSAARSVPDHSRPASSTRHENDISLATLAHAELVEERDQPRIRAVVEDEEAGVDRKRPALQRDVHRGRVAADVVAGLEQRDGVALPVQEPGGSQAGDAGTYDRDAHG